MPNVKVFVSHRIDLDSVLVENSVYTPVRCGAALDTNKNPKMIGDNTGDNISDKREYLGEFTVQYWAWKNVQADYYGLCHYRRYLSFSEKQFETDEKSQVIEQYLSPESIEKYRLNNPEYIQSIVKGYDALVGEYADISHMYTPKGPQKTVYEHFTAYDNFLVKKEDIDLVLDTIDQLYPDLGKSAREYFAGKKFRGYNCFILKKELFSQLCEIEVNVLRYIYETSKIDFTYRSALEKRTYGFFTEWLYGIFIYHLEKQKRYKIKSLQLVFFEKTETPSYIKPKENAIAIAYLTNRYFLPMTQTSIQSLVQSKQPNTVYDIIVAHEELTRDEIKITIAHFSQYKNISIRFISFRSMIPTASNGLRWERNDNITYAAAFLPWILKDFSKVIYLHSDLLVYTDLTSLSQVELNGNCLAASRDYLRICEAYKQSEIIEIREKRLQLTNHNSYFSTSLMLMELNTIRKHFSVDLIIRYALGTYYFRDAMNRIFNEKVQLLPANWNICVYSSPLIVELSNFMPDVFSEELKVASNVPYILHYPMHPKPWLNPYDNNASRFWQIARSVPTYERMIANFCMATTGLGHTGNFKLNPYVESFPRRVSNVLLPKGSLRRELAKKLCPKDSVLWNFCKKIYYSMLRH